MSVLNSILKTVRGIVKVRGNTDNTLIGNTADAMRVTNAPFSALAGHGRKSAIGVSAVQLTADSIPTTKGVLVKAKASNTGIVAVGKDNTVTYNAADSTDGLDLDAKDAVVVPVDNANKVWLIGSASGQVVTWLAL